MGIFLRIGVNSNSNNGWGLEIACYIVITIRWMMQTLHTAAHTGTNRRNVFWGRRKWTVIWETGVLDVWIALFLKFRQSHRVQSMSPNSFCLNSMGFKKPKKDSKVHRSVLSISGWSKGHYQHGHTLYRALSTSSQWRMAIMGAMFPAICFIGEMVCHPYFSNTAGVRW